MKVDNVPKELRDLRQWVVWKNVDRDGKATKLPYQTDNVLAKSNDATTWNTFDNCVSVADRFSGVGFVFSDADPFVGIDLDGCRDKATGTVAEWAREIITELDSYSEVSPSKTGVKIFVRANWPHDGGKKCNVDAEPVCDKKPGIEIYAKLRYFAVTSERLAGVSPDVEQRDEALEWLLAERFKPEPRREVRRVAPQSDVTERAQKYVDKIPAAIAGQRGHDVTFHVACVLVLGFGLNESDSMCVLRNWNQACEPPWSDHELQHKITSAMKQPGERNYLRDATPEQINEISVPNYGRTTEAAPTKSPVRITTLECAASKYLESLKDGETGLLETGLPELDYAIGGGYERGEMVILAARPSHGKSAVALQFLHTATANGLSSLMISEEMSTHAIGKRVIQFASDVPEEHWCIDRESVSSQLEEHFEKRAQCYIAESCGSADRAVEEIEKAVEQRDVKVVAVDYAQLLRSKGGNRYEQITDVSMKLRNVANRLSISILVLCQLNRAIEGRQSFTPMLSDLKETGQFEQDADVILFLVWPHRIDPKNDPHEFMIFVGKNRNRAINQAALRLKFNPSRQMVSEKPAEIWTRPELNGEERAWAP